jgi:hypothetical protein
LRVGVGADEGKLVRLRQRRGLHGRLITVDAIFLLQQVSEWHGSAKEDWETLERGSRLGASVGTEAVAKALKADDGTESISSESGIQIKMLQALRIRMAEQGVNGTTLNGWP